MRSSSQNNNNTSSRAKISKTLKEKWQDPTFRDKMIKAMSTKKKSSPTPQIQREKISAAMKKKWQDEEYRKKAMKGMEAYRESLPTKPKTKRIVSKAASTIQLDDVFEVAPLKKAKSKKKKSSKVKVASTSAAVKKTKTKKKTKKATVQLAATAQDIPKKTTKESNGKSKEKNDDGDISRMREERRDLYDLLYGDEPQELMSDEEDVSPVLPDPLSESGSSMMAYFGGGVDLDDENLDDFDPYGLDDN